MESSSKPIFFLSLCAVLVFCILLLRFIQRSLSRTKDQLLAADRKLGPWEASLSIAASWIWAPSLFVSAQKSYTDGILGLFWFLVPNVLCLVIFAYFADRLRQQMPNGFTLSDFVRTKTSVRVQNLYWVTLTGLAVCAFAVQLLAGGQLLARSTQLPYWLCTVLLAGLPFSYSLFSGLKGSIATDVFKMILIYIIGISLIPWALDEAGGWEVWARGLPGQVHSIEFFGRDNWNIFLAFGLPTTIGLISGPFGDQSFWQRAFAIRKDAVRASFLRAAGWFALVPLAMSTLGFIAAGTGYVAKEPQMVNLEVITNVLPDYAAWIFVFMIIVALISTLDTKFTGIASLGGHDFINRILKTETTSYKNVLASSRLSMSGLALAAFAIANIPGLKILHLFLFYGTLRSSTLLPTVMMIRGARLPERGVFWGVLASLAIGLPIFAYGNLNQSPTWIVTGSLLTVGLSGAVSWMWKLSSK